MATGENRAPRPATVRHLYREALRDPGAQPAGRAPRVIGRWPTRPDLSPDALARAIADAEKTPVRVIKSAAHGRVLRAQLLGRDALIKRYDLPRLADRLKYLLRPSRARRAWAAAQTFIRLGIPTPEPLGFLEIYSGPVPARSYFITAFMPETVSAGPWMRSRMPRQPPELRAAVRKDLLELLLALYRKEIYHADTKTPNLLVLAPEDSARRRFFWIDLECVRFGVRPTRHQVIRNLVQLNGSLRGRTSDEERMEFLRDMARAYPWVIEPQVVAEIRDWTHRRLLHEVRSRCGS